MHTTSTTGSLGSDANADIRCDIYEPICRFTTVGDCIPGHDRDAQLQRAIVAGALRRGEAYQLANGHILVAWRETEGGES